jgi:hypothetical protein
VSTDNAELLAALEAVARFIEQVLENNRTLAAALRDGRRLFGGLRPVPRPAYASGAGFLGIAVDGKRSAGGSLPVVA